MKMFKKSVLSMLTLGFFTVGVAQTNNSEELVVEKEYKNQFFMLPTSLADQIVQFGYERKFSNNNSAMIQLGMYLEGTDALQDPTVNGSGIRLEANYNLIFDDMSKKENHELNFYIAPYVNYFNASFKIGADFYNENYAAGTYVDDTLGNSTFVLEDSLTTDANASVNHFGLGANFGLRWTVSKRLVFDFYTGGGAQLSNYIGDSKFREPLRNQFIGNLTTQGVLGRAGVRVGVLF